MAYNRNQVRSLLNAAERELFEASRAAPVKTLTQARLRAKIGHTRALRDKYRDLLRRQKVATRGRTGSKTGISGVANERTEQKAVVFAEMLQRFEDRAQQLDAAQARATEKTAAAAERLARMNERNAARQRPAAKTARKIAAKKTPTKKMSAKKMSAKKTAAEKAPARKAVADKSRVGPALSKKARAPKAPGPDTRGIGPTSESARAARFAMQQLQSGGQRIQGHIGTQVRRAQAKRDSRG